MLPFGNTPCSFLYPNFMSSPYLHTIFFTNPNIQLFLNEYDIGIFVEFNPLSPLAFSSKSILFGDPTPLESFPSHNESPFDNAFCCSTQVKKHFIKLSDYHYFSTINSLYEPYSYREASFDLV